MTRSKKRSEPLSGSTAVITGASGGIGRQIAIHFAAAGCQQLLIHYNRNRPAAEQTVEQVSSLGTVAVMDQCDFADPQAAGSFIARAFERWPAIDIWVHCAGVDVLTGEAASWPFDQKLRSLIEVDLIGAISTGRNVGRRLSSQSQQQPAAKPPSLLFIGWDQASDGMEGDAGQLFAPIKAGVEAFAKSLAQELAPLVRVNTIAPGWIKTAWGESTSDYWQDRAVKQSLMQRWGTPDDVASAALFLCTPSSDFITGQTLAINGGWNRRSI